MSNGSEHIHERTSDTENATGWQPRLIISSPGQCCQKYCLEDFAVHNRDLEEVEWVVGAIRKAFADRFEAGRLAALEEAAKRLTHLQAAYDEVVREYAEYRADRKREFRKVQEAKADAWDEAVHHLWQLSDPINTLIDTESRLEVATEVDARQAKRENPYRMRSSSPEESNRWAK